MVWGHLGGAKVLAGKVRSVNQEREVQGGVWRKKTAHGFETITI